jgi:hypothetical protein
MTAAVLVALVVSPLTGGPVAAAQEIQIGIIDFYGLGGLTVERVRGALSFKEGDRVSLDGDQAPAFIATSEGRLKMLPGVQRARINLVCCDNGRIIVYVGLDLGGSPPIPLRPAPTGDARLAADIVRAADDFSTALTSAVERGDTAEDRSEGHALNHDKAMRAVQERFLMYANRDLSSLRLVLRQSSHAAERAVAAQVLGYAADKAAVVDDLVYGMSDPDQTVRNNALRALMVMAEMKPGPGKAAPSIPATPFIALLNSLVWSDRNKASLALDVLTRTRDRAMLESLRAQAIAPLIDIARWKSQGHAQPGFLVLARIAGYTDEAALDLWKRGERERVIQAARARDPLQPVARSVPDLTAMIAAVPRDPRDRTSRRPRRLPRSIAL